MLNQAPAAAAACASLELRTQSCALLTEQQRTRVLGMTKD